MWSAARDVRGNFLSRASEALMLQGRNYEGAVLRQSSREDLHQCHHFHVQQAQAE